MTGDGADFLFSWSDSSVHVAWLQQDSLSVFWAGRRTQLQSNLSVLSSLSRQHHSKFITVARGMNWRFRAQPRLIKSEETIKKKQLPPPRNAGPQKHLASPQPLSRTKSEQKGGGASPSDLCFPAESPHMNN